jgi:23S rRNA A1618 N6-methylase RlmF
MRATSESSEKVILQGVQMNVQIRMMVVKKSQKIFKGSSGRMMK